MVEGSDDAPLELPTVDPLREELITIDGATTLPRAPVAREGA